MEAKDLKVTTTSNFQGIKINEYLEPVTSHIVVGMNIFKDFMTSITDVFGGNSVTYEETLADINKQAIIKLKEKANALGANCIVGLKIDNDEISAQGKSMLMVTAVGTAAIGDFTEANKTQKERRKNDEINLEKELISKYNIENKDGNYFLNNYKYSNLKDAINYAKTIENKK